MTRAQQYVLRYEEAERKTWQAAADRAGLPLAAWIRAACNLAANPPKPSVLSPKEAKAQAARIAGKAANILAERMPEPRFPEIPQPDLATDCDHPREARKPMGYGTFCQRCGGMVSP
jgi:hypothetical protein